MGTILGGVIVTSHDAPAPMQSASATPREREAVKTPRCTKSAPTTAKGYANLWSKIDDRQWGGGDVSISAALLDGRVVWLYGDTISSGRFVHSSAIVQTRGCVHVSHGGAQVLPNGPTVNGRKTVYWIEAVSVATDGTLRITAEEESIGTGGVWDFKYTGITKTASATVDITGNVTFTGWVSSKRVPAANPGRLIVLGKGHIGYSVREHSHIKLAGGKTLTTMAQNYDDGIMRTPKSYAPLWFEGTADEVRAQHNEL